mgnify:CR=1 FL=1
MRQELYQHFHPSEKSFIDKADEWLQKAAYDHQVKRTDFLDPRQAFILSALANRYDAVQVTYEGGYADAERKRALVMPDYRDSSAEDAGVSLLEITSDDAKFGQLDHGDFLGAILGLGIKRDKLGDILPSEDRCHVLVASEIIDYVNANLRQVHRVNVFTSILPLDKIAVTPVHLDEMTFTVASMRLDAIVGDVFKLSRAKALQPIQAGHCKLNWKPETNPAKELREGDVVSLKGYGRFKILAVEGETKKGRIRVKAGKYA